MLKENLKIKIYYDKKSELEIIKKYQDLILYVYNLLKKYPLDEKMNLASDTKKTMVYGLEKLIFAKKSYIKEEKVKYLLSVESSLNILNVLIRVAIKNKYINKKNYTAWSYKIVDISNMLEKWIRSCQKQ